MSEGMIILDQKFVPHLRNSIENDLNSIEKAV